MHLLESFDGFDLQKHLVVDNPIGPVRAIELHIAIDQRYGSLFVDSTRRTFKYFNTWDLKQKKRTLCVYP